jgi:GR25 family glycosyltransferase involved in LPS biosynthesis
MRNNIYFFVFIISIICYIFFIYNKCSNQIENMNFINMNFKNMNFKNIISFNVITLSNPERLLNIEEQESILNIKIDKFDAINGNQINQDELVKNKILDIKFKLDVNKRVNEIGCYQSHLNLLKSLKNKNSKYHIIFEDDFKFVSGTNFIETVNKIISQTTIYSFDIIFLGWNNENKSSYEYFSSNLYWFNNVDNFYGTYGYLVNSNSLDKIIDLISFIDMQIDNKYKILYFEKKLNIYWSNIILIEPNYALPSTILSN